MKHTQGEWQIEFSKTGYDVFAGAEYIASIKRTVNNEQEANANLIAAAPDLLNELKNIVEIAEGMISTYSGNYADVLKAKEAIKKATA